MLSNFKKHYFTYITRKFNNALNALVFILQDSDQNAKKTVIDCLVEES